MARRPTTRGGARKVGGRRPAKTERKTSVKPTKSLEGKSASNLQKQLRQRTAELARAREEQAASAEVLRFISSFPGELERAFEAMLAHAMRLCEAQCGFIYKIDAGGMRAMAEIGVPPALAEYRKSHLHTGGTATPVDVMRSTLKPAHVRDARKSDAYRSGNPNAVAGVDLGGARTVLYVPMIRDNEIVGVINLYRQRVKPFTDAQIALLETFAGQAVIALENARLFQETREALERQTATADVLRVIAGSPTDLQPVFEAIADRSNRLINGHSTAVYRFIDQNVVLTAFTPVSPEADAALRSMFPRPLSEAHQFELVSRGEIQQTINTESADLPENIRRLAEVRGWQSALLVPLISDQGPLGLISVTRKEAGKFAEHQIALLKTFADQAVIAINNVRLFNETKEALERQTATADILKVIASSPSDVQPVFDAIAERANKLLGGHGATVLCIVGDKVELGALTPVSEEADAILRASFPISLRGNPVWEGIQRGETSEISDTESEMYAHFPIRNMARARGFRSRLMVPLKGDSGTIGAISVTRVSPGTFAAHHVQLLQTFADQAVIAIENTRLFNEVQAKTRDLQEALTSQIGSANILKVIASSPTDVGPVLNAIVVSACELCEAYDAVLRLKDGNHLRVSAHHGPIPTSRQHWPINRKWTAGRSVLERKPIQVFDMMSSEGDEFSEGREYGLRTVLTVPLLQEGESVGSITLRRTEVNPFSDKQINLLKVFADQAVIAIGNVRLFEEVQQRTRELTESLEQQTATAEVLEAISSSAGELDPVFNKMLENATRVCGANFGTMNLWNGEAFINAARHNTPPAFAAFRQQTPIRPHPATPMAQVLRTHQVVHEHDFRTNPAYLARVPNVVAIVEIAGARTILVVPMLKENELIGTITIFRQEVRPFTEKQIALVENFTKQAVIAIENTRLLRELRERTDDLTRSLDNLRAAQDRLVQTEKLASLGQLTAGIAHEIKNPLNFINNFSALSAELTDELDDLLRGAALTDKMQEDVSDLTRLLRGNLEKVVQHGKRADSIVKNMLLHSREGTGEQRSADINALVDESLNLAYHGARAENPGFNITLQRDFDANAGAAELFPQEITRALLNLISNGFYAAHKRKAENGDADFDATLLAATKDLGTDVEIRIRDNGTGIPPEALGKIFNPFFTTKPAGEGTGLGLSMSHDIIVKQHGGTIRVDTAPGEFTEFVITLPRDTSAHKQNRSKP